jgi:hypothetical protein
VAYYYNSNLLFGKYWIVGLQRTHIAHSIVWIDQEGNYPSPFTLISNKQIQEGVWIPKDPSSLASAHQPSHSMYFYPLWQQLLMSVLWYVVLFSFLMI